MDAARPDYLVFLLNRPVGVVDRWASSAMIALLETRTMSQLSSFSPSPVPPTASDARRHPRLKLPAPYTLLRVRRSDESRFTRTGYVYDISASGMRFELDQALEPGTTVEFRAMLPGAQHMTFNGRGRVVRLHDDADEPGPVRMGLSIEGFSEHVDRRRLHDYLTSAGQRLAA